MPEHRLGCARAIDIAVLLLVAYGASPTDAQVVAEHLVDAERVGQRSHGLMRLPQYVDEILSGEIDPAAAPVPNQGTPTRLDIDGRRCFGPVAAQLAVTCGARLAHDHGLGMVTVRQCGHAGRIGAYAEKLGALGCLSLIFCSGPRSGHRVAPFNGREGRLATNPLAFSVPTSGDPIVGDFSTAAAPEGRIRWLRDLGLQAPPETLIDPDGRLSTDPNTLYGSPPGAIMPFGGEALGHRGFALGLLVEAMATLVPGEDATDSSRVGNNLAFVVVRVDVGFSRRADQMAEYILSSSPRNDLPVLLPGSIEQARRSSTSDIVITEATWLAIGQRAAKIGLDLNTTEPRRPGPK